MMIRGRMGNLTLLKIDLYYVTNKIEIFKGILGFLHIVKILLLLNHVFEMHNYYTFHLPINDNSTFIAK